MRVVGIGARRGVSAEEVLAAVDAVGGPVDLVATLDRRAGEPGLRDAVALRGWALSAHAATELDGVATPTTSARVRAAVGTGSVAEAAALFGGGELVVPRTVHGRVTVAVVLR